MCLGKKGQRILKIAITVFENFVTFRCLKQAVLLNFLNIKKMTFRPTRILYLFGSVDQTQELTKKSILLDIDYFQISVKIFL